METTHTSDNNSDQNVKCALKALTIHTVIFIFVAIIFYIAASYGDYQNYLFVISLCSVIVALLMFIGSIINLIIIIRRRNRELTIRTANILAEELIDSRNVEVI